jgi:L-lysine 2,3-aminomutase
MTSIADQTLILIDKQQQAISELTEIAKSQSALIDEMVMTIRSQAVVIKDISDDVNDLRDDMIDRR